jgi:dihydropteroate synthase
VTQGRATLAGVPLGDGLPVAVMGALNVSPESFHAGSVHSAPDDLVRAALALAEAGAALIDVGARSTAPYGGPDIGEAEERDRLARAVELLVSEVPVPISADTTRPEPARAALEAGARVINDVSGLRDPRVAALVAGHGAGVILMAAPGSMQGLGGAPSTTLAAIRSGNSSRVSSEPPADATGLGHPPDPCTEPIVAVKALLAAALGRARAAGIPEERIVLDPGIGFFRDEGLPWDEWDARVLAGLGEFGALGRPLCVAVSRKSFIGAITGRTSPGERLAGSLAATAVAVLGGAALVRAHDVAETVDAVRVAERIRKASQVRTGPYNKDRP